MAKRTRQRRTRQANGTAKHPSGLTVRDARLERARPFHWAWEQRVLLKYMNLLIGEEGIGKGNLVAWLAARITRGELPGDLEGQPRQVVFIGDEDAWDHIWVPRLGAAGADLGRVEYIDSGTNGVFDVKRDADALRDYIKAESSALVYFDQLLDNLGIADSWKDKEVRDALAPLRRVAQETDSALLASMHPNKRGGSFRDRISGTPAFNALSRSSLYVARHPDEPGRVVVVRGKGNYDREPAAFEFRIKEEHLDVDGRSIRTSRIAGLRESALRRDELLAAEAKGRRRDDSQAGQARKLLAELFEDGEPRPAKEAIAKLRAEGIPERVVQRARREVGLDTWQTGFQGAWLWGYSRPPKQRKRRRSK